MRRIELLAVAGAVLIGTQAASAQTQQLALEVRGGYAIPTGEWNEEDTFANGLGIGLNVIYMVTPQVGAYAGYEAFRFDVDEDEEGVEANATDGGFRAGISFSTNVPAYQNVTPFIEAGVLYNTMVIEASSDGTSVDVESEASLGFEAGVGFATALNPRLSLVPVLRYRQHEVEFSFQGVEGSDTVKYVIVGLGLRLSM